MRRRIISHVVLRRFVSQMRHFRKKELGGSAWEGIGDPSNR